MNSWVKHTSLAFVVGVTAFTVPVFSGDEKAKVEVGVISHLELPLEHHPDGSIKTKLVAERAQPKGGVVEMTGMKVEITKPTGEVETTIEADSCSFDKDQNLAQSESAITLTHPDLKLTGTGFRWSAKDERIEVLGNVRVVLKKGLDAPLLGR